MSLGVSFFFQPGRTVMLQNPLLPCGLLEKTALLIYTFFEKACIIIECRCRNWKLEISLPKYKIDKV